MQVTVFPDVEKLLIDHVGAELVARGETAPGSTKVPNPRPAKFWRIRRTGGPRTTKVSETAQVTVEAWDSATETAASDLSQLIRGLILALEGQVIASVQVYQIQEFSGPANLPDPETGVNRYTQTLAVHLRGAVTS